LIVTAFVLAGGALWWFFLRPGPPMQVVAPLTPDAKAYVKNLKLADVEMKASENYMKAAIVEITGSITNAGDRRLRLVEIMCVFYDAYGQVVLRDRVPIVRTKGGGPLAPGETRTFRLPFDSLPASWNQGMPQLVIANIDFES
jgi:hypothetical protein